MRATSEQQALTDKADLPANADENLSIYKTFS